MRVWIVITGAPSSGKTTLLHQLQQRGYAVVPESAREILAEGVLDESKADVQSLIEQRQITKEAALSVTQAYVLDRALPDSLAYRRLVGMEVEDLLSQIRPERYATVFICGFGQHIADGIRKDDAERAREIERLLREVYRGLGCRVIELPWSLGADLAEGVAKRLELIEAALGETSRVQRRLE